MKKYPMEDMANKLAAQGRNGDTMLIHVNPAEVKGIASLAPGMMTTNPQTGQPEAWAFLIPLIAKGIGAAAGWGTWQTALLSGAMTAAATGDAKRGAIAAVTGGIAGSAASAGAEAAASEAVQQQLAEEAARQATQQAVVDETTRNMSEELLANQLTPQASEAIASGGMGGYNPTLDPSIVQEMPSSYGVEGTNIGLTQMDAQQPVTQWADMSKDAQADAIAAQIEGMTPTERLKAVYTGTGGKATMEDMMSQKKMLPFAYGSAMIEQIGADEDWDKQAKRLTKKRDAEKRTKLQSYWDDLQRGYAAAGHETGISPARQYMSSYIPGPFNPYGYGAAQGGQMPAIPMKKGGRIYKNYEDFVKEYENMFTGYGGYNSGYGGIDPVTVQKNLRHTSVAAPQDYVPGFNPEFDYFQKLEDGQEPEVPNYTSPAESSAHLYAGSPINRFLTREMPDPYYRQPALPQPQGGMVGGTQPPQSANPPPPANNQPPPPANSTPAPSDNSGVPDLLTYLRMREAAMGGGSKAEDRPPTQKNAKGGSVRLRTGAGEMKLAAGGIADIPTEFTAQDTPAEGQPPMQGVPAGMPQDPQQAEQFMQQQTGATMPNEQDLQTVAMAILRGGEGADQVINNFISKYGVDMFRQVREMVLQMQTGGRPQTEGMVKGEGGGMDDKVNGMIGDQQPVAVSPGEYIVPADVVSGLGDGSSDSGAAELDRMSNNVRRARQGGRIEQPPPFDARKVMPA